MPGLNANNVPNTTLVLSSPTRGDFAFAGTEVPVKIPFGGEQHLVVHELVGGARTIDAMGRSDTPLEWSGILVGSNALSRARTLDAYRVDGLPLDLTWSELSYSVVIKSFKPDYEQQFQIPYTICCIVVKDKTSQPIFGLSSVDDSINGDMASAIGYGNTVGDSTLTGLLGTLNSAIGNVSSFAQATQSTINSVLTPIAAVTGRVTTLIASTGNVLANVATLGGVLPGNPIAQQVSKLTGQVNAMTQIPVLYQLNSVMGRMGANLNSIGSTGQPVVTAGGNLYKMAADAYGDPTAWTGIARANGLTDPQLAGISTINIPALPDGAEGIFNA